MIPQAKIDAIKESASLLEIAAEHTKLKRRGTSHVGLCPFHAERTPSFTVSNRDEREFFHCFGYGAGGDVIAFENLVHGRIELFHVRAFGDARGRAAFPVQRRSVRPFIAAHRGHGHDLVLLGLLANEFLLVTFGLHIAQF